MISVDAAHFKSAYKGTISIYSGLAGNHKAYIMAFGISGGNEDCRTWNTFNTLFASPSVSFVEYGHAYSKFMFISDRDKGLDKSLSEISPRNHATNCVHHIKQNVKTWFGLNAMQQKWYSYLLPLFQQSKKETLLQQVKTKSANAYDYWKKYQWSNGVTTTTVITAPVWCGDI